MYKEALRPAWAEINLSNLEHNIREIKKKAKTSQVIGVIKADAYGHGAIKCAQVLRENGIKIFAVATLQEAIELRNAGIKEEIIILGLTPDMYADTIVEYNLTPVVCSAENARAISQQAAQEGKMVSGFLAVDTGMGRIGYLADELAMSLEDIREIANLPNFRIKGLFSHMSTADAYDKSFSAQQEAKFNMFYEFLVNSGVPIPLKTLANSASIMEIPTVHMDCVRPGIILYGCYPSDEVNREELFIKPVMSIKANIVHIKEVPAGFSVGYGRKYISEAPAKIATLPLGYADGYPRPFSKDAKVIVNGVLCPIAGNICMDQCMVDVTKVPQVKVGDEVVIMGYQKGVVISAEDIAKATGTISYEICCAFGQRLPKVYVREK